MDETRKSGAAMNLEGNLKEGFQRATDDEKTTVPGQIRQADGGMRGMCGQATVRQMPASVGDTIRHCIKSNPYTTAGVALSLGWLIGRSHRPF
jgi:uncharacterized protein YjbJ (UPF0337 family)